jgi:hypothetical protein
MNITYIKEVLGSGSYYGVETWLEVGEIFNELISSLHPNKFK